MAVMFWIKLALMLILLLEGFCFVTSELSFVENGNHLRKEKNSWFFDCTLNSETSGAKITWLKDSTIEVDRLPGVSFHNNKQILEIHNFSSRYTGVYKCNVKVGDRNGEIDRIFDVPPMQPPLIQTRARFLNITVGETAKFRCTVKRHYVKSYNWFFNVNQVSSDKHYKLKEYRFLRIRRVKIEDSGKYTCVVENNIGKSKMVYNLFVRPRGNSSEDLKPRLRKGHSLEVDVVLGDVTADCLADGAMPMNVTWYKNNISINDPGAQRKKNGYTYLNNNQTLLLKAALISDTGFYTCVVQNKYGKLLHTVEIDVFETAKQAPVFVNVPNLQKRFFVAPGDNITINSTILTFGTSHFQLLYHYNESINATHSKPAVRIVDVQMSYNKLNLPDNKYGVKNLLQYHFHNVSEKDYGMYSVMAGNIVGFDVYQFTLIKSNKTYVKGSNAESVKTVKKPVGGSSPSEDNWSQSPMFITLASVAGLLIFCLSIVALLWRRRSKSYKNNNNQLLSTDKIDVVLNLDDNEFTASQNGGRKIKFSSGRLSSCQTEKEYLYQCPPIDPELEVNFDNIDFQGMLGEGAFGRVMLATVYNLPKHSAPLTVAVKMLKDDATEQELKDLLSEVEVMKSIGSHTNIINILGVSSQQGDLCMIIEYCRYGNLRTFLKERRPTVPPRPPPIEKLTLSHLTSFCLQVAKGMAYLASKKCIHRDIAARNVLVGDNYVLKVADFGLARNINKTDYYRKCTDGRLPVKWMAIEALFDRVYTTYSDIWSFGILVWEIVTFGGSPYPGIPLERLFDLLKQGYRMEQPINCTNEMYALMLNCWKEIPSKRPTFDELVEVLEEMLLKIGDVEYLVLQPPILSPYPVSDSVSSPPHSLSNSRHSSSSVFDDKIDELDFDVSKGVSMTLLHERHTEL